MLVSSPLSKLGNQHPRLLVVQEVATTQGVVSRKIFTVDRIQGMPKENKAFGFPFVLHDPLVLLLVNSIQGLQTTPFRLPSFPDQSKLSTDDTIAHLARGCCNYIVRYAAEASNPARNPITMLTITAICW